MIRGMILLTAALMIDALQALASAALSVVMMFPGTVGGAVAGCLAGEQVAGDVGCKVGGFVLGLIGSIPFINAAVATVTEPVGIMLGFVISFCISATFGVLLIIALAYCKMFYPIYIFSAFTGEAIPGINLLPAWTALVIRSLWKKNASEKTSTLIRGATAVGSHLRLPDNPVGRGMRAGTLAPDMRAGVSALGALLQPRSVGAELRPSFAGAPNNFSYTPPGTKANMFQHINAFPEFAAKNASRPSPSVEDRTRMDSNLNTLGEIFEDSDVKWQLDGGLNISLMKGDYIGNHKDIDISVEKADLPKFESQLQKKGFGLFISHAVNSRDPKSKYVLERTDAAGLSLNRPGQVMISAVNNDGKIQENPFNYPDVHITNRNAAGEPIGENGVTLPQKWFEPQPTSYQGTTLNVSHPARVAYYKLHQGRGYDMEDLQQLASTGNLSLNDVNEIEVVIKNEHGYLPNDKRKKLADLKKWVADSKKPTHA